MTAENVGIGNAALAGTWSVVVLATKAPELASMGVAAALGFTSVWQLILAKIENRRTKKQE